MKIKSITFGFIVLANKQANCGQNSIIAKSQIKSKGILLLVRNKSVNHKSTECNTTAE